MIILGWGCSHLLTECTYGAVTRARDKYIGQNISYIVGNIGGRDASFVVVFGLDRQCTWGREDETPNDIVYGKEIRRVVSIYLLGGLFRPYTLSMEEGWADTYQIGFGALRLITPGFESYGFVYVAQFLQVVAPLYLTCLGGSLYGDMVSDIGTEDDSVSSREEFTQVRWPGSPGGNDPDGNPPAEPTE